MRNLTREKNAELSEDEEEEEEGGTSGGHNESSYTKISF